ncbi:MAG TPA: hypothetical protein VF456_16755 [Vicinamibacterales bacterium]
MVWTKWMGPQSLASAAASMAICLAAVMQAAPARAQNTPQGTTPVAIQGPIIIQRLESGWAIAPDVKVTQFDGGTHTLAGAYGGYAIDNRLLIGAAADWLTDPQHRRRELAYGGAFVQWRGGVDRLFGYSVQGLIGGGSATATGDVSVVHFDRTDPRKVTPVFTTERLPFREDFFVAEPGANVIVRLSSHVRLHAGGGYRAVAGAHGLNDEIRGAVGSVALEIGPGSHR